MLFYKIVRICVYIVLIVIGVLFSRCVSKYSPKLEWWLSGKHINTKWVLLPLALSIIAYIVLFYFAFVSVKSVYAEPDAKLYHYNNQCDSIKGDVSETFKFEAELNGYSLCEECELQK